MTEPHPDLEAFLDEVSAQLGRRKGKRDLLLELRSAVLDHAEETGGGEADPESIRQAVAAMGRPSEVALAYVGEKYLIGPRLYRAFLLYTGLVFVIHLVMIIVASVVEADIEVFPIVFGPVAHPNSFVNLVAVAIQALLLDIGLMVVIFTGVARVQRSVRIPRIVFRVQAGVRSSVGRAVLAVLALVLLNPLRDRLFVVVIDGKTPPLFTPTFVDVLPWLNAFLGLVIAKELAYALKGERRPIVAADAALAATGAGLMIWFLTLPAFFTIPELTSETTAALPTLNQLVHKTVDLLLIMFVAAFAFEAGKRFFRLFQMWD